MSTAAVLPVPELPTLPFRPHATFIVVMRDSPFRKLGGIIVPDDATQDRREGVVLDVGDGYMRGDGSMRPVGVKRGDRIFWRQHSEMRGVLEFAEVVVDREKRECLLIPEMGVRGVHTPGGPVPFEDAIIVRRKKPSDVIGSIYVPDQAKTELLEGVVVAAGPGPWADDDRSRLRMWTKVGDTVCWPRYATDKHGSLKEYEGTLCGKDEELLLLSDRETVGVRVT